MTDEKSFVESHFDEVIGGKERLNYAFDVKSMGPKDKRIALLLQDYGLAGKRCLDIGPGTGRWLTFMKESGAQWLAGVDISSEVLERCGDLCDFTQKCDLEKERLSLEDNSVDVLTAIEVLEHIRNPENFFSEIVRVCKPGALVLMTMPNIASFISRIRLVMGLLPVAISSDPTHVRFYRQKDLRALLKKFDLEPQFHRTSFSLVPTNPKSKLRVTAINALSNLDDSHVFTAVVRKGN